MYGYDDARSLSPEQILDEVTQEEIFQLFIDKEIIIDKGVKYIAPYRNDKEGDCYFEEYDNKLHFVDFASLPQSLNWYTFVGKCISSSDYYTTLNYITKELNLGKGNKPLKKITAQKENVTVELKQIKKNRSITYLPRKFNHKDKQFWSKYNISMDNLEGDKVIPISMYQSTSKFGVPFTISTFDLMYAYTEFPSGKVKIYRPEGDKLTKWFTNCNQNDVGGTGSDTGDLLLITKSYKDYRVVKNMGVNTRWFQNEGMFPSITILKNLVRGFKRVVIWFDNDEVGILNSKVLVGIINSLFPGLALAIHLDVNLLKYNIKDASDLIAKRGEEELIVFAKQNKLII